MTGFVVPTVEEVMSSRRESKNYSELRFPDDLGPHAIVLNFSDYNYSRQANTVSVVTTSSICLPLPGNLVDSFAIKMNNGELGVFGNMSRAAFAIGNQFYPDTAKMWEAAKKDDDLGSSAVARAIKAALSSGDNSVTRGAEIALGGIVNQHVALSFEGIDLKTHNFDWMFAPTSSSESVRLAKIIRTIKASILPSYKKDAKRTFLMYPKVVDIFFLGTEPGHMYFFKRCMVTGFEANYAPSETPTFLPNGRPGFVQMKLAFTEMEIHTSEDYGGEAK